MSFGRNLQEQRERNAARKESNLRNLCTPSRSIQRGVYASATDSHAPVVKEGAVQHEGYMSIVRQMPCAHCGAPAPSQFCHADMDKGIGIKTDCRRGFPGCPTCHALLGSSGKIPRALRRELEAQYGARTREKVWESGQWPKRLPRWQQ